MRCFSESPAAIVVLLVERREVTKMKVVLKKVKTSSAGRAEVS
jgi:hypothetical protein